MKRSNYGGNRAFGRPFQSRKRHRNPGESLDPMVFVKQAVEEVTEEYKPKLQFSEMGLNSVLQRNIKTRGYEKPTPIQDAAIGPILAGRDVVGIANTGTGKTAAFLLPLISKVASDNGQRILIVVPTRELAVQISDEFKSFVAGLNIKAVVCIGGVSMHLQVKELRRHPNVVIGTPGRILDLKRQKYINLAVWNNVVLDEVDRMLDMGFVKSIKEIVSGLPNKRQSLFFSATLPEEVKQVMNGFLHNPITVSVKTGSTSTNVEQDIIRVGDRDKLRLLHELLIREEFKKVLVFGRTKHGINKLEVELMRRGFRLASIHGNKSQSQRLRSIQMLKDDKVKILLATDVVARGIDIEDITHVINYDIPESYDDYVHRIGRTGRAGKRGIALTFVK